MLVGANMYTDMWNESVRGWEAGLQLTDAVLSELYLTELLLVTISLTSHSE